MKPQATQCYAMRNVENNGIARLELWYINYIMQTCRALEQSK